MARGKKTGGRAKGTKNKRTLAQKAEIAAGGLTPLEYMLRVLRDPTADNVRRDWMAKAVAPYCHPSLRAVEHSGSEDKPIKYRVVLSFD